MSFFGFVFSNFTDKILKLHAYILVFLCGHPLNWEVIQRVLLHPKTADTDFTSPMNLN